MAIQRLQQVSWRLPGSRGDTVWVRVMHVKQSGQ